jgi:hypothetical protein
MVKIAVAGGTGGAVPTFKQNNNLETTLIALTELAREVVDALVAARKHEITILTRRVRNDPETSCHPLYPFTNVTIRLPQETTHLDSLGAL